MGGRQTRLSDTGSLPPLSDQHIAELEAANGFAQIDRVSALVREYTRNDSVFTLRPSTILELNRLAVAGLEPSAGTWRTVDVEIVKSQHRPPDWQTVPGHVEEMCDYVNSRWSSASALHLASYLMWKVNWIHPFANGNGRTSRAVSYLVLSIKLGYELPGENSIPNQIANDRSGYYQALDDADQGWREGRIDVSAMEALLRQYLASQLLAVVNRAGQG